MASQAQEVKKKRPPVLISGVIVLLEVLPGQGEEGLAMFIVALVAFWGMAWLGELLSDNPKKDLPRWYDLEWADDRLSVQVNLRCAKTEKPGETQQLDL